MDSRRRQPDMRCPKEMRVSGCFPEGDCIFRTPRFRRTWPEWKNLVGKRFLLPVGRVVVSLFAIFHVWCIGSVNVSPTVPFMSGVFPLSFLCLQETIQNPANMETVVFRKARLIFWFWKYSYSISIKIRIIFYTSDRGAWFWIDVLYRDRYLVVSVLLTLSSTKYNYWLWCCKNYR